jgi:hypothetical protein
MRPWTEEYYDILEDYAWAPDRLGHKSDPDHKLENPTNVVNRLRRLEEPMNHILGIFFALAPSDIVHEVFRRHAGLASEGSLKLLGHTVAAKLQIGDLTQPDFAFDGTNSFLTIEAKVGTNKSSLEQLLKYAALHAAAKKATPGRIHGLLYLSSSSQVGLFSEPFVDWSDLKRLANERLPHVKKGTLKGMSYEQQASVLQALSELHIGHVTYSELADLIEHRTRDVTAAADEVAGRLYKGVVAEIDRRQLRP